MLTKDPLRILWNEIRSFLHVTHTCVEKEGKTINVGETFTLKLTVTNAAPSSSDYPRINFKNPRLMLRGTPFAGLATGQLATVNPPEVLLAPGEAISISVKMLAIADLPPILDSRFMEDVLIVSLAATLDLDALSKSVFRQTVPVREEIYEAVVT